ncbi:MAG: histidine triad nucleotide-binding protein [Burkholderiales bacterium]|jgi:histidine triad (HIT) family protein|nr:histidine triad nucleotide-binding protein [Burkholderiales bacterium]
MHDPNCIFCKIVAGEIPCRKAHEDAEAMAFHDIRPLAPVHLLVIPKRHIATLYDATPADEGILGRLLVLAPVLAKAQGAGDGFRVIMNTGRVGRQEVQHIHLHVIGGPDTLGPMLPRGEH